jgi:hypothetical protein
LPEKREAVGSSCASEAALLSGARSTESRIETFGELVLFSIALELESLFITLALESFFIRLVWPTTFVLLPHALLF